MRALQKINFENRFW